MEFKSTCAMAFVIATCNRERIPINRTKAQKLLYCCYGTMLAATGERLTDEHPRAWPFGPVFPRTFEAVNRKALTVEMVRAVEEACDPEVLAVLEKMLRFFGTYTSEQLARWSRKSGSRPGPQPTHSAGSMISPSSNTSRRSGAGSIRTPRRNPSPKGTDRPPISSPRRPRPVIKASRNLRKTVTKP